MIKTLKAIIVENDDNDFELLIMKLKTAGYELKKITRVQDERGFREALQMPDWDVILSDYTLPEFSATSALTALKQSGLDIPFIIVSGTIGEERAVSSLRAGARDFVSKFDLTRLIPVIEREVREFASRKLKSKVEEAFKASEQRYRLIVDTAREGIIMLDPVGMITFVNKEMSRLLGLHEQEILRRSFQDFITEDIKTTYGSFVNWLSSGDGGQHTLRFTNCEGESWWGSVRVSSFSKNDRAGEGFLCMITDVTEQEKAKKTIETLVEELKTALKARDEFLSIASHELKTPLTTLVMQSQQQRRLISKGDERAYDRARINSMAVQTERLSMRLNRLVEDMLDISRIRAGKLTIIKEETNYKEIVQEVINRLSTQFMESGSGIPDFDGEDITGHWDVIRLEQVISNLLTNAIKYGGGTPVKIVLSRRDEKALLVVEDQGPGIEESAKERIFERFERNVNSNDVSGLGLGLYISREIIKEHQGQMWVESEPGKGAKFFVELPLNC